MSRPENLFEAASYELNKFIERRMTERRATYREGVERRQQTADHPAVYAPSTTSAKVVHDI